MEFAWSIYNLDGSIFIAQYLISPRKLERQVVFLQEFYRGHELQAIRKKYNGYHRSNGKTNAVIHYKGNLTCSAIDGVGAQYMKKVAYI